MEEKREHSKATILTTITLVVVFLLLFFFGFNIIKPEGEEGIMINFGDSNVGMGMTEPAPAKVAERSTPAPVSTPPPPVEKTPVKAEVVEEVKTQDLEEAPVIPVEKKKTAKELEAERVKKELEKKALEEKKERERIELERKIAEQKEKERLEKERLEKERQAEAIRKRTQSAFSGGKGTTQSQGQGNTTSPGNAGAQNGDTNSGSISGTGVGNKGSGFDLSGRSLVGSLPQPEYTIQEEGIVVIQIEVNKEGKVVSATPILKGATTQDAKLRKAAIDAALKARFNNDPTAPAKQSGTITYHFQLD